MEGPIPSQLEMMGRELKCPICLSLLSSAVSLLCNHVFCNSCIVTSMKSGSSCPVCKVPFSRRDVRAAPHMDNLVSIYKNIEIASGLSIFVTQNVPANKLAGGENHPNIYNNRDREDVDVSVWTRSEDKSTSRVKGSRKSGKSGIKNSIPSSVKPSFPTKKRVQVPQYPSSESLIHGTGLGETNDNGTEKASAALKEKPALNEKGEPVFLPFFWLREEDDAEKLSQQSDKDQHTDSSLPYVPSFSDIKDSDDELPFKLNASDNNDCNPTATDLYDSEMFEWTQRPRSPELCSSPFVVQAADNKEDLTSQQIMGSQIVYSFKERIITDDAPQLNESSCNKKVMPKKRKRTMGGKSQKTYAKCNTEHGLGNASSSTEVAEACHEGEPCYSSGKTLTSKRTFKKSKKAGISISHSRAASEDISSEIMDRCNTVTEVSETPGLEQDGKDERNCDGTGKKCRFNTPPQKDCDDMLDNRKEIDMDNKIPMENPLIPHQMNEDLASNSFLSTSPASLEESSTWRKNDGNNGKATVEEAKKHSACSEVLIFKESEKNSFGVVSTADKVGGCQVDHQNASAQEAEPAPDVMVPSDFPVAEKLQASNGAVLQKCGTMLGDVKCAFCHSSECSEISGEMICYRNGKPVAAEKDAGSRVIYSHKNCAEWAPNVYFEDGRAINLEAEVARSRRIKCCCCGIKGAALGCYEKTCRKSFHVTCAKMTPQCRWDTLNFVVLCPLHTSSKLPMEISRAKEFRESPSIEPHPQPILDQVAKTHQQSACWKQSSCGSREKMVLCCSALAKAEREIVYQFESVSRVKVVPKWNRSVTHVIASIDENGACKRTFKVLMGILEGKWILSVEWIKNCIKAMEHVSEERYEISVDIHGMRDGPRLGRLRVLNMQPKLFNGLKFYFMGEFDPSYKGCLQDLVVAAGGTVLHRRPISEDEPTPQSGPSSPKTFIIYSIEMPDECGVSRKEMVTKRRLSDAEALARLTGAKVATSSWLLDSIASCKLEIP